MNSDGIVAMFDNRKPKTHEQFSKSSFNEPQKYTISLVGMKPDPTTMTQYRNHQCTFFSSNFSLKMHEQQPQSRQTHPTKTYIRNYFSPSEPKKYPQSYSSWKPYSTSSWNTLPTGHFAKISTICCSN